MCNATNADQCEQQRESRVSFVDFSQVGHRSNVVKSLEIVSSLSKLEVKLLEALRLFALRN